MKSVLVIFAVMASAQAGDVDVAVKRFYVDQRALDIRGTVEGEQLERCSGLLTPSLRAILGVAQDSVQAWREAAKQDPASHRDLKPPPGEGPLFTGVYEGGEYAQIESVVEEGDRAYVTVRITPAGATDSDGAADWSDMVILHRADGRWLIDDILSWGGSETPSTVRGRLTFSGPPDLPNKSE